MSEMSEQACLAVAADLARQQACGLHLPAMCPINVMDLALAVLRAMRIPTEAMIHAGDNEPCEHSWGIHPERGSSEFAYCEPIWQAMIDEALKP